MKERCPEHWPYSREGCSKCEAYNLAPGAARVGEAGSSSSAWICAQTWLAEHARAGRWWQGRIVGNLYKAWDVQLMTVTDAMIRTTDFGEVWWAGPVNPPPMPDEASAHIR